jgi:hypothetical protein
MSNRKIRCCFKHVNAEMSASVVSLEVKEEGAVTWKKWR